MLDDLFGSEGNDVQAGKFDIGLVIVGIGLIVLYLFGVAGSVVAALGIVSIALGLILPARAIVHRFKERRAAAQVNEVFRTRTALNIGHPVTDELAAAYGRALALHAVPLGHDVAEAAHAAVVEVAHALRGRVPGTDSEIEYVRERTSTIDQARRQGRRSATAK